MEASEATRSKMSKPQVRTSRSSNGSWRHTVDERVQDGHGAVGDTSVGVDLLED